MPAAAKGRPKGSTEKPWRDAIRLAIMRKGEDGRKLIAMTAEKLVSEAAEGNVHALKEIGDRLDGKASHPVEHSGDALGGLAEAVRALAEMRKS